MSAIPIQQPSVAFVNFVIMPEAAVVGKACVSFGLTHSNVLRASVQTKSVPRGAFPSKPRPYRKDSLPHGIGEWFRLGTTLGKGGLSPA
jgi:hypothetical protein